MKKTPGFVVRATLVAFASTAVAGGLFGLVVSPFFRGIVDREGAAAWLRHPGLWLVASLIVSLGFGFWLARFLFVELDREAAEAIDALQPPGEDADDSKASELNSGGLGDVAARLSEWRHRAKQADAARSQLDESLRRLAAAVEASTADGFKPIGPGEFAETESQVELLEAVNAIVGTSRRMREISGVLLSQIEDDLAACGVPLEEAGERLSASLATLTRSEERISRALLRVHEVIEAQSTPAGAPDRRIELTRDADREISSVLEDVREARVAVDETAAGVGRARRAGSYVERELSAVRRRLGGVEVTRLTEADFVPGKEDSAETGDAV